MKYRWLRKFVFEHKALSLFVAHIKRFSQGGGKIELINKGFARINKDIKGFGNRVEISEGCFLHDATIRIRGNNNILKFGENCKIGPGCSFWMEGNNISIHIGEGATFTRLVHINAQEDGSSIEIGRDCMFSNNIIIRTSDSHPIYDLESGERTNPPKNIRIGDHVWIAPNTKIMKGAIIESGAVIGSDTTITNKLIKENTLVVGRPARIVKENIKWTREALF